MRLTRRSLVQMLGSTVIVGTSGCMSSNRLGQGGTIKSTNETKEASTSTTSVGNNQSLSFSAEVIEQQSKKESVRIEAQLENTGSEQIQVQLGPTLMFTDNAEDLEWANKLVLDPDNDGVLMADPTQSNDGCWRFPADEKIHIQSIQREKHLNPNSSISETYKIYTRNDVKQCLPEGSYRFQDQISAGNDLQSLIMTLVIEVADDHTISTKSVLKQA